MRIRRIKWRDLRQVTKIFQTGYGKRPYSERWSKKTASSKIRRYYDRSVMFVAVEGKEVLGFSILDEDRWPDGVRGWFEELVVGEAHQGKGVGSKLMKRAFDYFRERKFKGVVGVTSPESRTWGWYQRLGFKDAGLRVIIKDFQ